MKLNKVDKIGLFMMLSSIPVFYLALYWSPFAILAILLLIVGGFIWNPLDYLF